MQALWKLDRQITFLLFRLVIFNHLGLECFKGFETAEEAAVGTNTILGCGYFPELCKAPWPSWHCPLLLETASPMVAVLLEGHW